jgi:hypothetical protein
MAKAPWYGARYLVATGKMRPASTLLARTGFSGICGHAPHPCPTATTSKHWNRSTAGSSAVLFSLGHA